MIASDLMMVTSMIVVVIIFVIVVEVRGVQRKAKRRYRYRSLGYDHFFSCIFPRRKKISVKMMERTLALYKRNDVSTNKASKSQTTFTTSIISTVPKERTSDDEEKTRKKCNVVQREVQSSPFKTHVSCVDVTTSESKMQSFMTYDSANKKILCLHFFFTF
jgi:hypothetical protein